MKVCNNCSTVNDNAVVKCIHCMMPNNFTFQGVTISLPHEKKDTISCLNCGSQEPGSGAKCLHCHFPLPAQPGSASSKQQTSGIKYSASN